MATASWTCSVLESEGGALGCSGCGMPHLQAVTASLLEHAEPEVSPLRPAQHGHAEVSVAAASMADIPAPRAISAQRSTETPGRDCTTSMRARMSRVTTAIYDIIPPGGVESSLVHRRFRTASLVHSVVRGMFGRLSSPEKAAITRCEVGIRGRDRLRRTDILWIAAMLSPRCGFSTRFQVSLRRA